MTDAISGKTVLFITTKNLDYIRNVQEIGLLKKYAASYTVIGSYSRYYPFRIITVFLRLLFIPVAAFDVIFIGFSPQLVLPFFRRKFRKKYILIDFFISLYDTFCLDRQKFSPKGIPGRFLHQLDSLTLSLADLIICDTVTHGQYFIEEFRLPPHRLHPLYLTADAAIYHPTRARKPDQLQDKFIVLYFGSILPLQGTDIVLKAMSLLKEKKDIFFYFIGPVKDKSLQALCPQSLNIRYISWLPQKELAELIGQSDLCLAGHFSKTVAKASRTIPGKAYIYQAMKKPMILGDNPANHELFHPNPDTVFVEMGNPQALADAIISCFNCHTNTSR